MLVMGALTPRGPAHGAGRPRRRRGLGRALRGARRRPAPGAARVHVKLDTGMGRLGTRDVDQVRALADAVELAPRLELAGAA